MAESRPAAELDRRERRQVFYSGHVQGVGFRYTVRQLADGVPVTGFVRNEADGRVQLVVEGPRGALARLLDAIQDAMSGHIRDMLVDVRPATGEFRTFEIRY